MPGRYTDAQRAGIMANRKARDAGTAFGYDYGMQGYNNKKEEGKAAYSLAANKAAFGTFADPTRDQRVVNGVVQWRNKANTPERVAEGGDQWQAAPDYVQRGYTRTRDVSQYGSDPATAWQNRQLMNGLHQQMSKGLVKAGGDGKYYYASGQAFDSTGRRIDDDTYTNPALAAKLFGQQQGGQGQGGGMWGYQDYNQYGQGYQAGQPQRTPQVGPQWGSARGGFGWGAAQGGAGGNAGSGFSGPTAGLSKSKGGW